MSHITEMMMVVHIDLLLLISFTFPQFWLKSPCTLIGAEGLKDSSTFEWSSSFMFIWGVYMSIFKFILRLFAIAYYMVFLFTCCAFDGSLYIYNKIEGFSVVEMSLFRHLCSRMRIWDGDGTM
jgi:hypothetical protein